MDSLPLTTRGRVETWLYTRCSKFGTPFGVGLLTDNTGNQHTFLVDGRDVNLDLCPHLPGCDIKTTPTEKGLRMSPLTHQPEALVSELMEKLEQGLDPDAPRAPELVEDTDPPAHPADDEINPSVPVIGELIAYCAKVAMERGLPMAGWAFIPPTPG